jgi:hypothetical protein
MSDKLAQLYIIQEGLGGPVKIGRSKNALARCVAMQTGNSSPLKVCAVYTMTERIVITAENWLHLELEEFAIGGEWFDLSPEFMSDYMPDFLESNGFEVIK